MKINDIDSFNEKCDKVLRYLAEIATKETNVQILTHLNTLCSDMGINVNDPIIRFLERDKGFIYMPRNEALVQISSSGLAFISPPAIRRVRTKQESANAGLSL